MNTDQRGLKKLVFIWVHRRSSAAQNAFAALLSGLLVDCFINASRLTVLALIGDRTPILTLLFFPPLLRVSALKKVFYFGSGFARIRRR
jgi:hypothetical protein